ncbi:uncharacterized protein MELLADRAFT_111065 [Melampsora larici-populina 98AG31]|uniref:Uncharacterized protein n=1 Tax=Melampsora larici-populina (strain 98AG31 / pathotype 3-4-7) TaxID=747676 RepID=F4S1X8_MELLP|nr:uncharacterized protein MELLADRAFT_111065 [Melampsora larici-populina 98AG31]EGG01363.1 hypothetical protein MELLADRAFT_111065 [Melampsora larici-populina 98AG31]
MASNSNNKLFPETDDPRKKLRAFSRQPTAPPENQQQQEKQMSKKKHEKMQPVIEQNPKRIIVKGYGGSGNQKEGQKTGNQQGRNKKDGQQEEPMTNSLNTDQTTLTGLTTIAENPPTGQSQNTTNEANRTIDQQDLESDSSLEYVGSYQHPEESSDEETSWVKMKEVKREPESSPKEGRKLLTGLVSSPSMRKGKQRETRQPTPGPSRSQAAALLEIREALDKEDYGKHAELMTAYLLRYNPEKIQVLASETEQAPQLREAPTARAANPNPQTAQPSAQVPLKTNPTVHPLPKTSSKSEKAKPSSAVKNIPKGRPMSDEEDEVECQKEGRGGGFVKNGIEFVDGQVPSHHMAQLTVFWDNRIRKFKGYVPVSMFNQAWLYANAQVEGKKASKKKKKDNDSDSEEETYEGLVYPNELRLSYGDWITCFNLMLDYLRRWFDFKKLANKFEGHKRNVENIKAENDDNWMIALRYDILLRRQIWTIRVEGGKVGDPSNALKPFEVS